jgi:hypothetical protein
MLDLLYFKSIIVYAQLTNLELPSVEFINAIDIN